MDFESLKNLVMRFVAPATVAVGAAAGVVTLSLAISKVSEWWLAAFAMLLSVLFALALFLFINKSAMYRSAKARCRELLGIFDCTHNSWHMYKRLSDKMHQGTELDHIILHTHRAILNLIENFRTAMLHLHPDGRFHISLKGINYKNIRRLNEMTEESYKHEPFILLDLPLFRGPSEGPTRSEDVIDKLDFDPATNPGEMSHLKETLFYRSFISKDIEYIDKFSDVQQSYTNRYKSALVAPVVLHGIPFAFMCVGAEECEVFCQEDRQIVATFVDALAEYIRLERIFHALSSSRKVVVMGDVAGLLDGIREKHVEIEQDSESAVEVDGDDEEEEDDE